MINAFKIFLKFKKVILSFLIFILTIKYHKKIALLAEKNILLFHAYLFRESDFIIKQNERFFDGESLIFKSKCNCRKETVQLDLIQNKKYTISQFNETSQKKLKYEMLINEFRSSIFTCDLYSSLRRGPNQKIISYSLYGNTKLYYKYIKDLIKIISILYPGWYVRIYHDNSIDDSFICEIECLKKDDSLNYYDIADFCNIEKLPYDLYEKWNASYMHGMTWRWLPIGDSFVDFIASRDTDSWIYQREIDSVNVWMNSNTLFHVMRDNPMHDIEIVGCCWGFANKRDKYLARYFFQIITNRFVAGYYNKNKNGKGYDQFMLTDFFSKYSFRNSTTHDSYSCVKLNGDPFPTQRVKGYFVGCVGKCEMHNASICPKKCRPKYHQDWIKC